MACPLANALGTPNQGFHGPRVLGLARNDLLLTLAVAVVLNFPPFAASFSLQRVVALFFVLWAVGIALHWAAGTDSALLRALGVTRTCPASAS